jgi:hypothetical protein
VNKTIVPIILLGSGVALSAAGLVAAFVMGSGAPLWVFVVMLVGIADGMGGLVWAAATILWGGAAPIENPGPAAASAAAGRERDRMRRILLAAGVLSIVFLGILAAIAFRIPLIIRWLRASGAF